MNRRQQVSAALELIDISVHFAGFTALNQLSLNIPVGQFRAMVGPNGAGKTTAINVVHGAIRPQSGTVRLMGEDVTAEPEWARTRRGLARTYQVTDLFPGLSVLENISLSIYGLSPHRWAMNRRLAHFREVQDKAMHQLELTELQTRASDKVSTLSHGEQRQLELAMVLASEPSVLLLDEPAAGLSPAERHDMLTLLQSVCKGRTVLMIEHNFDLVHALADEVTVLHHGAVVTSATPSAIQADSEVKRVYLS